MNNFSKRYAIGDIHGDYDAMNSLFEQYNLIKDGEWIAKDTLLVCVGDYVDRGTQGIQVIDALMKYQKQSLELGSQIVTLIGNHEINLLYMALLHKEGNHTMFGKRMKFFIGIGGQLEDLSYVINNSAVWKSLENLPLLFVYDGIIFQHMDSVKIANKYSESERNVDRINMYTRFRLRDSDNAEEFFDVMSNERRYFQGPDEFETVMDYLNGFGVNKIIHGHTPYISDVPYEYMEGKIVNIDCAISSAFGANNKKWIYEF